VAVAIAATFGFRRYLIGGVLSSIVSLAFGFQTILNVAVAMTFRLAAGGLILLLGNLFWVVILAGPVGTFCGRLVLSLITQTNVWVLVAAASVGMVYTAVTSYPICLAMTKLAKRSGFRELVVPKRNIFAACFRRKKQEQEVEAHDTV
jgi:hypothetical protein